MTVPGSPTLPVKPALPESERRQRPGAGNWRQRLRLGSGLVLFTFCLSHFLNHSLGIISVEAMDKASVWHYWVWRSPLGEMALISAALIHITLALWRTGRRRTLKMPRWEFFQLALGLYIPWALIPHVATTMGIAKQFGFSPVYPQMLTILWPDSALTQSILLLVVWSHAMIGLHFWLRLYPAYRRLRSVAAGFAIAVPVLALWGWIEGARRLALTRDVTVKISPEQRLWAAELVVELRAFVLSLIAISLLIVLMRYLSQRFTSGIAVTYPGGLKVHVSPGPTLLEISRMKNIPHAAVCGGRARCSTCRVKILQGMDQLDKPGPAEAAVLARIAAAENVRLACQVRPTQDIEVRPLVPAKAGTGNSEHLSDAYYWGVEQDVAVMFVDLRNFTRITESQLAYDVVHLLNRYLDQASAAIHAEGGHVDKFIGDGIMAIFGMKVDAKTGARQALRACRRIEEVMKALEAEKGPQFRDPIRLGIGLHMGPAILGRIGAAGATGERSGLTALGDVVNTASRLETENKAHNSFLAVSKAVIDLAEATIPLAEPAEITLRGKEIPLQIYTVVSLDGLLVPDDQAVAAT